MKFSQFLTILALCCIVLAVFTLYIGINDIKHTQLINAGILPVTL